MKYARNEAVEATLQAEESLLGAILIESSCGREAIRMVRKIVEPLDFLSDRMNKIYHAMLNCQQPHQINVAQELHRTNKLFEYDCSYLCHLVSICPCSLDYESYALAVKRYANSRNGVKVNAGFRGIEL